MSCGALLPSAHMSTSVVASVFGWNRRLPLCGGTESNSAGRPGDSAGFRR
jgi:hypothetical protein